MDPISITNAEHYSWKEGCEGWHLFRSDRLSVIRERMLPGTSEDLHYHNQAQQVFYILSGTATFTLGKRSVLVKAHESLHIPARVAHCIRNEDNSELAFLVISEPKSHGDRINL